MWKKKALRVLFPRLCITGSFLARGLCLFPEIMFLARLVTGLPKVERYVYLEWLQHKDALEEGKSKGDDPLNGQLLSIDEAVEQGEEGGHSADGEQQEPAHKHEPPGEPTARLLLPHHNHWPEGEGWRNRLMRRNTVKR